MVQMVQTVPMVPMVLRWRREASIVPRVQILPEVLTIKALGKAGVGTHGGRRACMARRLCCVLRACGACVWCVRRGLRSRTLGAVGSAIAGAGRRGRGERWRAAAVGMAHRVAPDM